MTNSTFLKYVSFEKIVFESIHAKVFFNEKHFLSSENSTKPSLEGNHDRKKKKKCLGIEVQGPKNLKLKCCGGVP